MKNIFKVFGIALIIAAMAFSVTACPTDPPDDGSKGSGDDSTPLITWTLTQIGGEVGIDGVPTADTTAIKITFSTAVILDPDEEVYVDGSFGDVLDITGLGTEWTVDIDVHASELAVVYIEKDGVEPGPKDVMVYKTGDKPPINFTVTANGSSNVTRSTQLTFTFTEDVDDIDDIYIDELTGWLDHYGNLSGSGRNYTLDITVGRQGEVLVFVDAEGVTSAPKAVNVFQPLNEIPKTFTITGLNNYMSGLTNKGDYEYSYSYIGVELYQTAAELNPENESNIYGYGYFEIGDGDSVTMDLLIYDGSSVNWKGTGNWHLGLWITNVYFNGPSAEYENIFYTSTAAVNFNAANITRSLSANFKMFVYSSTIGEMLLFMSEGMYVVPGGGTTLNQFVGALMPGATWDQLIEIELGGKPPFYKNEALTQAFTGTETVQAGTKVYSADWLPTLGPKLGDITGSVNITGAPAGSTIYVAVEGGKYNEVDECYDPSYCDYWYGYCNCGGWDYWESFMSPLTGTGNTRNFSIPVYEINEFIPGSDCWFSLYVVPAGVSPFEGYWVYGDEESIVINTASQNVGNISTTFGTFDLARLILSGTVTTTMTDVEWIEIGAYDTINDSYIGWTDIYYEDTNAWTLYAAIPETNTEIEFVVYYYNYNGYDWGYATNTINYTGQSSIPNIVIDLDTLLAPYSFSFNPSISLSMSHSNEAPSKQARAKTERTRTERTQQFNWVKFSEDRAEKEKIISDLTETRIERAKNIIEK